MECPILINLISNILVSESLLFFYFFIIIIIFIVVDFVIH